MKDSDFKSAQRAYDSLLPEPEGKFTCKQCGERRWESDKAGWGSKNVRNWFRNVCAWCADENILKEFEKDLDQYKMKEPK